MDVREQMKNIVNNLGDATESPKEPTPEKKKVMIEVNGVNFDGVVKTKLITTNDFCLEVNKLFKNCLNDYEGCILEPDLNGNFTLKMYLSDSKVSDPSLVKCLKSISASEAKTPVDRLMNFNIAQRNKMYTLTDSAKDVLENLVVTGPNKKVDWSKVAVEFTDSSVYGATSKIYTVVFLDLYKVVKTLYGTKLPDGGSADYKIIPVSPVGNTYGYSNISKNYLLSIMQLDTKMVNEISRKIGLIPQDTTGFAIVRS